MKGKQIKEYPKYSITEDGLVLSYSKKSKGKVLKPQAATQNKKYYQVRLFNQEYPNGKLHYLHRLVYEAFVGEIGDDNTIDHIDENTSNNHYTNLQVMTQSDNSSKSNSKKMKLVDEKDEIRRLYHEEKWSQTKIAKHYGCSTTHIWRIINKKRQSKKNGKWVYYDMLD